MAVQPTSSGWQGQLAGQGPGQGQLAAAADAACAAPGLAGSPKPREDVDGEEADGSDSESLGSPTGSPTEPRPSAKDMSQLEHLDHDSGDPAVQQMLSTMLAQSEQLDGILARARADDDIGGSGGGGGGDSGDSSSEVGSDEMLLDLQTKYASIDSELQQLTKKMGGHGSDTTGEHCTAENGRPSLRMALSGCLCG